MSRSTGVPYFVDSEIPSAVFLGLHLLVTDPSTSPRTPLGRAIFGVVLRTRRVRAVRAPRRLGLPTFYDKLLCVPLLNLAVPGDRSRRARDRRTAAPASARARRAARPRQRRAHGRVGRVLRAR